MTGIGIGLKNSNRYKECKMSTSEQILVSVLMTAYNREKYIAEAIESVIASSLLDWELIIVDDCSTDKSVEIARSYERKDSRIKVYRNEKNLGQFPNRNKAANLARGKFIKYLDSDDTIYPYSLEIMVGAMNKFPEAGMGLTFNNYNDKNRFPFIYTPNEAFEYHFFKAGLLYIGPSGSIYNREVFNKTGGFGEYGVASDYEFNLRICMRNPLVLLQRDLVWWRMHEGQEFNLREKEYIEQNYKIHQTVIHHTDCPLSNSRKKELLININKHHARKIIVLILKFQLRKACTIYKVTQLPLSSFIYALIPRLLR